jgi:magnesium chelatase subunit I
MINLLDEYIPIVEGSELNDDPLAPLSHYAKAQINLYGDDTPIAWLHRSERYVEKLATPDVTVADLIGDLDPIKAANQKLSYSDERSIHFGLIPRANRCIFVINELPDLQARIQVALFNILQEGDIQIRGFKLRLPLDLSFVFTANPEDYTNRGSIITPLKDRIESQILTHYPQSLAIAQQITAQEADLTEEQRQRVEVLPTASLLLERLAFAARKSEMVDEKSGVSARLSIAAYENLVSTAERRSLLQGSARTQTRLSDFQGILPAITGKMELVYEGEQEGPIGVAQKLLAQAIKETFLELFPNPEKLKKNKKGQEERDPYGTVATWFAAGNVLELPLEASEEEYRQLLDGVAGLERLVEKYKAPAEERYFYMELILHALVEFEIIQKELLAKQWSFKDPLAGFL